MRTHPYSDSKETTKQSPILETWLPVVKLARMWGFNEVYKHAVENMPYQQICSTPTEKVAIAVKYDIKPWLIPALNELAKREEPLGIHDLELLGPEVALKVAAVRESLTVGYDREYCPVTSGVRRATRVDFTSIIKRVFSISGQSRLLSLVVHTNTFTCTRESIVLIVTCLQTDVDAPNEKEFRGRNIHGFVLGLEQVMIRIVLRPLSGMSWTSFVLEICSNQVA